MPRVQSQTIDANRQEYLLLAAAGILCALVVLVIVTSERIKSLVVPTIVSPAVTSAELAQARLSAITVERDVHGLDSQIQTLDAELESRKQYREVLATVLVASEKELADQRAKLTAGPRKEYDFARDLSLAKAELEKLERQRVQLDHSAPKSLKIESYPTPLSKPVDSKELHVQLRGGRVTVLPVDELVERLKNGIKDRLWKLRDSPEMTDTVGPVDGFRMRYTLIRVDVNGQSALESGHGGSYVSLDHWELVPVSSDLGEPWQEALGPTSLLRAKLDQTNPRTWTVTLWVYPDSFDAFRALRKEFYRLDYLVAGRPLPENMPIGGSPRGTKSAAQ